MEAAARYQQGTGHAEELALQPDISRGTPNIAQHLGAAKVLSPQCLVGAACTRHGTEPMLFRHRALVTEASTGA